MRVDRNVPKLGPAPSGNRYADAVLAKRITEAWASCGRTVKVRVIPADLGSTVPHSAIRSNLINGLPPV
jgi:hypothetical protein